MPIYRIVAAVNTAPDLYDGYTSRDRVAAVTSRPGTVGPILFTIAALDPAAALEVMWEIGDRVTDDWGGRWWPPDVRSLSTGDVLALFAPGYPVETQQVDTYAVAPTGFDPVPDPRPSAWVPLDGSPATSRPAGHRMCASAHLPSRDSTAPGAVQL